MIDRQSLRRTQVMRKSRRCMSLSIILFLLVLGSILTTQPGQAAARGAECNPGFFERPRLLDSCIRALIEGQGISFDGDYIGNFYGNPAGGRLQKFRSAWRSTFGLNFDLEQMFDVDGAALRVSGAWTAGRNLATDVETIFNPAEIYGLKGVRFWELHWSQKLFQDQLTVRIGRQSPGEYFTSQPPTWDYTNLGFITMGLLYNEFAYRTRPIGMWGVTGEFEPKGSPLYFTGGVYSGAPRDIQRTEAHGLDFRFKFKESTVVIGEIGYKRGQTDGSNDLPGTYRFGTIYNSARFSSLSTPGRTKHGNVNFYLSGEQMLFREAGNDRQGLTVFGFLNVPVSSDINLIKFYAMGGLTYRGLFDGLDEDRTYVGAAFADINNSVGQLVVNSFHGPDIVPNQSYEAVLEAGHVFQVTPFWAITPSVQYIINPGLTNDVKNAFVTGIQTVVDF